MILLKEVKDTFRLLQVETKSIKYSDIYLHQKILNRWQQEEDTCTSKRWEKRMLYKVHYDLYNGQSIAFAFYSSSIQNIRHIGDTNYLITTTETN
jgi:hypothetical protein